MRVKTCVVSSQQLNSWAGLLSIYSLPYLIWPHATLQLALWLSVGYGVKTLWICGTTASIVTISWVWCENFMNMWEIGIIETLCATRAILGDYTKRFTCHRGVLPAGAMQKWKRVTDTQRKPTSGLNVLALSCHALNRINMCIKRITSCGDVN